MYPSTLTAAQRKLYVAALGVSTKTRVTAQVLNRDHKLIGSVTSRIIDGQVNFNRTADVARTLQAGFVDIDEDLEQLDLRHLIRVRHSLYVPALDEWATTTLFTGVVVAPSEQGDVTTLECHGKEAMGLYPGAPYRVWHEGRLVAATIRDMFEDIGETKFRISPGLKMRLTDKVVSGGRDEDKCPTRVAKRLAAKHGLQWFYDAEGYMVLRRPPKTPVMSLSEDSDVVTGSIGWTRDLRTIRNAVKVFGKKKAESDLITPAASHVFSPRSLRRGGKNAYLKHYVDAENVTRKRELNSIGRTHLDRVLTERMDASIQCAPFYHAETHDRIRAERRNGTWGEFYLTEASIPLASGDMTIGYQERRRKRSAGRVRIG